MPNARECSRFPSPFKARSSAKDKVFACSAMLLAVLQTCRSSPPPQEKPRTPKPANEERVTVSTRDNKQENQVHSLKQRSCFKRWIYGPSRPRPGVNASQLARCQRQRSCVRSVTSGTSRAVVWSTNRRRLHHRHNRVDLPLALVH